MMHKVLLAVFAIALSANAAVAEKGEPPAPKTSSPAAIDGKSAQNKPVEKHDVFYDPGLLPDAVRNMRDKILEAALSGDTEKLKIVIQSNEVPPAFSFGEDSGDPITAMKAQSNDGEGREGTIRIAPGIDGARSTKKWPLIRFE